MNSWNGGRWHKIERIVFCRKSGSTPHQESEDMIRKMEGTRNVQGCYVAKSKTQQMCRSQGINGQLVGLEQLHGSSFFVNVYQRVGSQKYIPS